MSPAPALQPRLDWDRECPLPVAPSASTQARHASATGAQMAAETRAALSLAYIALLRAVGPRSDHEAARALGVGVSSINSTRDGLGASVVASDDYETRVWPNGRTTKRTRWMLRPAGHGGALDHGQGERRSRV